MEYFYDSHSNSTLKHRLEWQVGNEPGEPLDVAELMLKHYINQAFVELGIALVSSTKISRGDKAAYHVFTKYADWLHHNVGKYRHEWFAHAHDDASNKVVIRFVSREHAMLFKLTFQGTV